MAESTFLIACGTIQDQLVDQFGGLNGNIQDSVGVTRFLASEVNTAGTLQKIIDKGNGKKGTVQLLYTPRSLDTDVDTAISRVCTGGDKVPGLSETYEIDYTVGSQKVESIEEDDLIENCEADELFMARAIQRMIDAIVRKMNKDNITQIAALFGNFVGTPVAPDTAVLHNVKTKQDSTSTNPFAYVDDLHQKVVRDFEDMESNVLPWLFGSGDLGDYFRALKAGCCANTLNIDLGVLASMNELIYMRDADVQGIVGANEFIAMVPGAAQLLTFNKYRGSKVHNQPTYKQGTLVDPKTGIEFDYTASFNCGVWTINISLAHKIVALPDDIFDASDKLTGVNWINNYKILNA